jgi:NAD(P)H-quinone oxidoreductase subunit 4L
MLQAFLVLAAALIAIGLYGALSQQTVVMLMMGLELMISGVITAATALWWYCSPGVIDGQVLVLVVISAMTVEMAMGFAAVILLMRASDADMTDMAAEFKG